MSRFKNHWDVTTDYARIVVSDTDQWAKTLSSKMLDVPHRHAVMTLPDKLRPIMIEDQDLWKVVGLTYLECHN